MCERCDEIDAKIKRYSVVGRGVTDKQTLDAIDSLIADLKAQKKSLHPNEAG